jgi:hypothetical protein
MRIQDSTLVVSTNPQPRPFNRQYDETARLGGSVSDSTFGDYLKAKLQASSEQTVSRQAEYQIAGILLGRFPWLVSNKAETKERSDHQSPSEQ